MVNGDDEGVKGHKGDYHDDDGEGDEDDGDDYDGGSSSDGDDVGSVMIIAWLPCITGRPRGRSWPGLSEQLHPLHTNMLHNAQCTSIVHKLQHTKQLSILERKYEAKPRHSQTFPRQPVPNIQCLS